jgi:hypothetical protein
MAEFSAALFATQERPHGPEHRLIAHALLFLGSRPYWEVYIRGKVFRFISNPDFLLEDGLWQLNTYCQIPENEYKFDVSNNVPLTLEEEFGDDICKEARANISIELAKTNIHFKLVQWPGYLLNKWNDKINDLQKAGINITAQF